MKKFTSVIVDTIENLQNSSKIIPDGVIVKIKEDEKYKVGTGRHTWAQLEEAQGKSAYEIAKDKGFVGDEEAWLESLRGAQGIEGPQGPKGNDGAPGEIGPQGIPGKTPTLRIHESNLEVTYNNEDFEVLTSLDSIKGQPGDVGPMGPSPQLKIEDNKLKVSYEQGAPGTYVDLVDMETLRGPQGLKGEQGTPFKIVKTFESKNKMDEALDNYSSGDMVCISKTPQDQDNAQLYVKEDGAWKFIVDMSGADGIQGPKGDNVQIRRTNEAIEYSYDGTEWTSLIAIKDISGISPKLRKNNDAIEINEGGDEWTILTELEDLRGRQGAQGPKGDSGDPGKGLDIKRIFYSETSMNNAISLFQPYDAVILSVETTPGTFKNDVYMKVLNPTSWKFIVSFDTGFGIQGPKGDKGDDGKSILSTDVIIRARNGYIECSTDSGATFNKIVLLQLLKPANPVFRFQNGWLQHSENGTNGPWNNLLEQNALRGPIGPKLQFSDLTQIEKEEIRGEKGDVGPAPNVDFKFEDGKLKVAINESNNYKDLIDESKLVGPSNFDIAKRNGFEGSEAQWLETIRGPQGPRGPIGQGLDIKGFRYNKDDLPVSGNAGDVYLVDKNLYFWNSELEEWVDAGSFKGLDGDHVNIPKHDSYLVDKVGLLRAFLKGTIPVNYLPCNKVQLLKKQDYSMLYNIVGDVHANKIGQVETSDGIPLSEVPSDSFVLDKFSIFDSNSYVTCICTHIDNLHYRSVGEVVFVHANEVLDEKEWLPATKNSIYNSNLYPGVSDIFEKVSLEECMTFDVTPQVTIANVSGNLITIKDSSNVTWTMKPYFEDGTTIANYGAKWPFWHIFNKIPNELGDNHNYNCWISQSGSWPKYIEIARDKKPNKQLHSYTIRLMGAPTQYSIHPPIDFELQGCEEVDGNTWVTLDSQTNVNWRAGGGEEKTFVLDESKWLPEDVTNERKTLYSKLRLKVNSSQVSYIAFNEIKIHYFDDLKYLSIKDCFKVPDLTSVTPDGMKAYVRIRGDLKFNHEGPRGKNAYELAQDYGFEGTYYEWVNSMKGPMGYVHMFNVLEDESQLPINGDDGVGYLVGKNLWIWTPEKEFKNLGQWRQDTLYEATKKSGFIGTQEEFDSIITNMQISDVKSWEIVGEISKKSYILVGCNSKKNDSYVVVDENNRVLLPNKDYTIEEGHIILEEALEVGKKLYVREFNHGINVERYSEDLQVGNIVEVLAKIDPGDAYVKVDGTKPFLKKDEYTYLASKVDQDNILHKEVEPFPARLNPNAYGAHGIVDYDLTSNPFIDATSNNMSNGYRFERTSCGNSLKEAWQAFNKSTIAIDANNNAGWVSASTTQPQSWMFSTGANPKHRLYKYYFESLGASVYNYPKKWTLYYTTNHALTLASPNGDDPSKSWVVMDVRDETRLTKGFNSKIGCIYNIANPDNFEPFAALKITMTEHFGTGSYFVLPRVQFFTIDVSNKGGNDFKIHDYTTTPLTSPSIHEGYNRWVKVRPTISSKIQYMNDYELWLSQGHSGTYDEYMLSRYIVPNTTAFNGIMDTLVKRFDFRDEAILDIGKIFFEKGGAKKYNIKVKIANSNGSSVKTSIPYIRAIANGQDVNENVYWRDSYFYPNSTAAPSYVSNLGTYLGYIPDTWSSSDVNNIVYGDLNIEISEHGIIKLEQTYTFPGTGVSKSTSWTIGEIKGLQGLHFEVLNTTNTLHSGYLEIYEHKAINPIELSSKEVLLNRSYHQDNFVKDLFIDAIGDFDFTITSKYSLSLELEHPIAMVTGPEGQETRASTKLLEVTKPQENTINGKIQCTPNRIVVTLEKIVNNIIELKRETLSYFIAIDKVIGSNLLLKINGFTGSIKITKDVPSHMFSVNPDSISGLSIIESDEPNTFSIAPGSLEINGKMLDNKSITNIDIIANVGDREVLDKNLPLYVYAYPSETKHRALDFQVMHQHPNSDRYGNLYNEFTSNPESITLYLNGSDKNYRYIGQVKFESNTSTKVTILVPTTRPEYNYKYEVKEPVLPNASASTKGLVKLSSNTPNFEDNDSAITPKILKEILAQSSIKEFTFVGNGAIQEFELDATYLSKDVLVCVGNTFQNPNQYTIIDKKLRFFEPVPQGINISVRPLVTSVTAYTDYKNAIIASRLSMYVLHANETL